MLTSDRALSQVRSVLQSFLAIDAKTAAMYKKNLALALLALTFALEGAEESDPKSNGLTGRTIQLGLFLERYFDKLAAFGDIQGYLADLSFEEARCLVTEILPRMLEAVSTVISASAEDYQLTVHKRRVKRLGK